MSTELSAYSLGLSEMVTVSASQTLDTFKQILGDIELVAGSGIIEKIVGHTKNTMSDRHTIQKNLKFFVSSGIPTAGPSRAQVLASYATPPRLISAYAHVCVHTRDLC